MPNPTYEELLAEVAQLRAALAPQPVTPSPRQLALAAGEVWYQPLTPCAHGHLAPRRVSNGSCQRCEADWRSAQRSRDGRPADGELISRDEAHRLGLTVYRTGKPCKRGHTGLRYVSTGACVGCYEVHQPIA